MKTMALILARGGSKGVPKKNIKDLCGFPLIAYSITAARLCKDIERVVVSTDSDEIAKIAQSYGAEIPFMRPSELAQDKSTNIEVILHALDWFRDHEVVTPELIVQILPTTPLRDPQIISEAIELLKDNREATSLRSVQELPEPPQKMMGIKDGYLCGLFPHDPRPEYYNLPRQLFPPAYHPNGYVEILRSSFVREGKGLFGPKVMALVTPAVVEIDRQEEFDYLEYIILRHGHLLHRYLQEHFSVK